MMHLSGLPGKSERIATADYFLFHSRINLGFRTLPCGIRLTYYCRSRWTAGEADPAAAIDAGERASGRRG
jgi:hypothetical protein